MCPTGDEGNITIGNNSNLQDGTVVRSSASALGTPAVTGTTIGNNVTIGHNATLRACTIADASLIGMDATILEGAQVNVHAVSHIMQAQGPEYFASCLFGTNTCYCMLGI